MLNALKNHQASVLLGPPLLAAAILLTVGANGTTTEIPIAHQEEGGSRSSATHPGGTRSRIQVDIVPEAVIVSGNIETIRYHADMVSNVEEPGTIAWTALMVTDTGTVAATLDQNATAITPRGKKATASFTPTLPDGYYTLRVRTAFHTKDWDDAIEVVEYLVVTGGKLREIDFEDWYKLSKASVAVLAPPGFKLGESLGGVR
jgi:hypothetical protein